MQLRNDFSDLDILVLDVDGVAGSTNCRAVLVEIGSLTEFDIEGVSLRRCPPVGVTVRMRCALNLHARGSTLGGDAMWKRQISFAAAAPAAVVQMTLARFIPALDEVVVNIRDGWASQLDVDVVILPFTVMPG